METTFPRTDYRVVVRGRMSGRFARAFDGLHVEPGADNTTTLTGSFGDAGGVYRLLDRLRDLGIELVSVDAIG